ncbi:hypothetical protein [Shigella flexneri]|uniref:hypothetical protein n=1 Tax=Shigella flexneri TaxID=623 RepID=UPI000FFB7501|nr:hypothetical protein [Shigella flexneri]
MSIKNDGHYFCRAGGNRPDGLNEPVTNFASSGDKSIVITRKAMRCSALRYLDWPPESPDNQYYLFK